VSGGLVTIDYVAAGAPLDAAGLATVRTPSGEVEIVPLQRTSSSQFSGRVRVAEPGAYWVAVTVDQAGEIIASGSSGAVSSYADEFAFRAPDPSFATELAAVTGGRVDPDASAVFEKAPVTGKARQAIWPWLAGLALILFLVDVALRRLVFAGAVTDRSVQRAGEDLAVDVGDLPGAPPLVTESETVGRLLQRKRKT
jgi:hypothetical protein